MSAGGSPDSGAGVAAPSTGSAMSVPTGASETALAGAWLSGAGCESAGTCSAGVTVAGSWDWAGIAPRARLAARASRAHRNDLGSDLVVRVMDLLI